MLLQTFWNESGELLCITTDESFFILKYCPDMVEKARESPDTITEDGIEDAFEVRPPERISGIIKITEYATSLS